MQVKKLYTLFYIAALMFVAKPFLGFSIVHPGSQLIESHSLLAKSFSNRKPEDLEDAKIRASSIRALLMHPPVRAFSTIAAFLVILFPAVFRRNNSAGNSFIALLQSRLFPPAQPYLLAGKLTI